MHKTRVTNASAICIQVCTACLYLRDMLVCTSFCVSVKTILFGKVSLPRAKRSFTPLAMIEQMEKQENKYKNRAQQAEKRLMCEESKLSLLKGLFLKTSLFSCMTFSLVKHKNRSISLTGFFLCLYLREQAMQCTGLSIVW